MQAKTRFEKLILKEVRGIPEEKLPHVVKILHSLKESIIAVKPKKHARAKSSSLCGIWKDDRSAEEIINDIHSYRTGFGGRDIEL